MNDEQNQGMQPGVPQMPQTMPGQQSSMNPQLVGSQAFGEAPQSIANNQVGGVSPMGWQNVAQSQVVGQQAVNQLREQDATPLALPERPHLPTAGINMRNMGMAAEEPTRPMQSTQPVVPQRPLQKPVQQMQVRTIVKKKKSDSFLGMMILLVVSTVAMVFMGLFIWSYLGWNELKSNFDGKVENAAKGREAEITKRILREMTRPTRVFRGPQDYGNLNFEYPAIWSVYVAKSANDGGDFEAYLKPDAVPAVGNKEVYALRVKIEAKQFDKVVGGLRNDKKLKMTARTVAGQVVNFYEGESREKFKIRMMVMKVRDKTVILRTDAEAYYNDFEKILQSLKINE